MFVLSCQVLPLPRVSHFSKQVELRFFSSEQIAALLLLFGPPFLKNLYLKAPTLSLPITPLAPSRGTIRCRLGGGCGHRPHHAFAEARRADAERPVEAMQLGWGLLKPGVAAQQPWHVRVHLERFDHVLGLAPGEPGDLAACEEIGELHERPGFAGGDSCNACHVMLLFPEVADNKSVDTGGGA